MQRTGRWAASAALGLFVLGAGVLVTATREAEALRYTVQGTLALDPGIPLTNKWYFKGDQRTAERAVVGTDCSDGYSATGYADIREGAPVMVSDERGTTIATAALGPGKVSELPLRCVFIFAVEVPKAKFYKFQVSHRGQIQKSFDEMKADGWKVSLTLG